MTDATNPFDSSAILDGIRRWVEIETPTELPAQVDNLADLVASGYRDLPATVERIAGKDGCGDHIQRWCGRGARAGRGRTPWE